MLAAGSATAQEETDETSRPANDTAEMKPTEIGVRFTPKMARAIGKHMSAQMKHRYDLDDEQVSAIGQIVSTRLMVLARENAELGRTLIETMIETGIHNQGDFPKEAAQAFGKQAKPLMPVLKEFFVDTAGDIGKEMTFSQRLKLTGDMTVATAALLVFENRMKRWEEGKVGDNANPFWDPADSDPSKAESEPEDPDEHPEHRRARRIAERQIEYQIDLDKRWGDYVERAVAYYEFTEAQQNSADAVLRDCQKRAVHLKTPEWRTALVRNRIARQLSWRLGADISRGPWMFSLEAEYTRLRKPLTDLDEELKRRLENLPTSTQRAAAEESVRKTLSEKGLKSP